MDPLFGELTGSEYDNIRKNATKCLEKIFNKASHTPASIFPTTTQIIDSLNTAMHNILVGEPENLESDKSSNCPNMKKLSYYKTLAILLSSLLVVTMLLLVFIMCLLYKERNRTSRSKNENYHL